ncbi:MAG: hypothetical protein AMS27_11135 [Bacteroides sp. SM23_62_1]|nr:MAG: hypothetical protein AMS27_11135 [Bacteroides sp. SM23_62_1]
MKKILYRLLIVFMIISLVSCKSKTSPEQAEGGDMTMNILTPEEEEQGWKLLFDGETLNGWHSFLEDTITGWVVEDGTMKALGMGGDIGGDIVSDDQFENFELCLEWKIAPEGNSGILYLVVEDTAYNAVYETGPEYQLLDDEGFPVPVNEEGEPEPLNDDQFTGSNYGMHPAQNKVLNPAGEWNTARIIINNGHVEHWLNGDKVVEYELWTDEWKELVQAGKWADYPGYGSAKKGHLALQDHGSFVWFRNVKIKEL